MRRAMVPSDIDIEDKLIGPLTLKQFIYLVIGAMAIFVIYTLFKTNIIIVVVLSIPVLIIVGAFAFYHFNEQPFEQFLSALIAFYSTPNKRIWIKQNKFSDIMPKISEKPRKKIPSSPQKKVPLSNLEELAYILDTKGSIEDEEAEKSKK